MDSHCIANGVIDLGGRVTLRPMQATYEDGLWVSYWRNRERGRYFSRDVVTPTSHMRWCAGRSALDEIWMVYAKEDPLFPIGLTSITVDVDLMTGEYGRTLVDEYWQGRRLGREIEYTSMALGFELLRLDMLWGELYVDNEIIAHVHDQIGWRRVGINLMGHRHPGGDVLYIECTRRQWEIMRQQFAAWMLQDYQCELALGEWRS